MKPIPKTFTWFSLLPIGITLAWDRNTQSEGYYLVENDTDRIIVELAGWKLFTRVRDSNIGWKVVEDGSYQ